MNSPRRPQFVRQIPPGDERERLVCTDCGHIQYENPKVVAGAVCTRGDRVLLCKRAIEPRRGYWTVPAGFMELHETTDQAAAREAWEEACARITIVDLLAVYSIPHISQVHMMFRARLDHDDVAPGIESTEVGLFRWDEIPYAELAFPSVRWALHHYRAVEGTPSFAVFTESPDPPSDGPGSRSDRSS